MKAVYCKCKNTYSIKCDKNKSKKCHAPDYWKQGIGNISSQTNYLLQQDDDFILQEDDNQIIE
tara:strand:- start:1094 stop:1282 length:189 start_codon:yes stop_codon:yes gene_type:complete